MRSIDCLCFCWAATFKPSLACRSCSTSALVRRFRFVLGIPGCTREFLARVDLRGGVDMGEEVEKLGRATLRFSSASGCVTVPLSHRMGSGYLVMPLMPRCSTSYCIPFLCPRLIGLEFPMPPTRSAPKNRHMHHNVLPLKCKYAGCARYFHNTNGLLCHQRAKHLDSVNAASCSPHVPSDLSDLLGNPYSSPRPTRSQCHVSQSDLSNLHGGILGSSPSQRDALSDLGPENDHQSLNAQLNINSDFCSESSSPEPDLSNNHHQSVVDHAPLPNASSFHHSLINGMLRLLSNMLIYLWAW
jgi:hypothetical protein